ncbi:MAG: 4-hydroxythreonine-4-phosphate dehydrogenase PdxA [Deltaproteobacteria bacterium]|nr:4-hydroxythreonine-4-phosphate dehydrogenase PdxA [Deltaproteobacteria bacterium]MDA8307583.1 4-hydroxythreonine-4-phosphate dehydrogenase PdxA [Deltaproteobacteria bacterium]
MQPVVAITMGDPCGIGPEVIVKAFDSPGFANGSLPLVIGDRLPIERAIKLLGSPAKVMVICEPAKTLRSSLEEVASAGKGAIPLWSGPPARGGSPPAPLTPADIEFANPSPAACEAVVAWIKEAASLACGGFIDAVCTCPINKERLHGQGFAFPGHTEFFQELTGSKSVVMMLAGPVLRVALATIHVALAEVPGLITKELLREVIGVTAESMRRDFAVKSPRVAVCGLNPHCGEAGKFGKEEIETIRPVIGEFEADRLLSADFRISGPWPADTVFNRAMSGEFDAVVALYHDQGLIPVKLAHFNEAVNVSLGLQIVRTSVDHGTAYDIAGKGLADPGSLIAAVKLAASIAVNRS